MNSNLQNKLQRFSADPPERVWDKIADALNTEETFSQRLYQYEEPPPAAAWQKIETGLEEEPAKVIPFATRYRTAFRYAAAACFFAVILVTLTLTLKRTEAGALEAGTHTTVPAQEVKATNPTKPAEQNPPLVQTTPPAKQYDIEPQIKETAQEKLNRLKKETAAEQPVAVLTKKTPNRTRGSGSEYASESQYVMYSDGDGNMRKMSKKVAPIINCKDDDGNCKQRLQQLQEKLAAKVMPTDFTGILEMLRQLQ